jgi:hypothetical protein
MEEYLSRADIRGMLRARCGYSGSDATSGQIYERHNGFIEDANATVLVRRQWGGLQREYTFTFGVDQRLYNYPPNCRMGNILAIGVWSEGVETDSGYYVPLKKSPIGLILDTDPISGAGGDPALTVQGMPRRYQLKTQIEVYPRAEKAYLGKIDHTVCPRLIQENDVSVVDAYVILWLAIADEKEILGDDMGAATYRKKAEQRLRLLSAHEHHGEVVAIDDTAIAYRRTDSGEGRVDPIHIVDVLRPG